MNKPTNISKKSLILTTNITFLTFNDLWGHELFYKKWQIFTLEMICIWDLVGFWGSYTSGRSSSIILSPSLSHIQGLSLFPYLSLYHILSLFSSLYLSLPLSLFLSIFLSLSLSFYLYFSLFRSLNLSISISFSHSLSPFLSLYLPLSLSIFLSLNKK